MNTSKDSAYDPASADDIPVLPAAMHDALGAHGPAVQSQMLRAIVDAIPDAIIVHSPEGRILFFSEGARRMLGYSEEEMGALAPFGWISHAARNGSAGRLERILYEGELRFESEILRGDGSTAPTDVASRRVDSPDGPLVVSVIRDVTERKAAQQQLVYLAYHDALTGLSNRTALEDRLHGAIADARRFGDVLAVGYIDLDRFKPVNDSFGHETGDETLIAVGGRLVAGVREQDTVARIGGDEFVLVLPRLSSDEELATIAHRLLESIRQPIVALGNSVRVDASIGFALFDPHNDDARTLVAKSDVAMYAAKHDPANPWRAWEPTMGLSVADAQRPSSVRELLEAE